MKSIVCILRRLTVWKRALAACAFLLVAACMSSAPLARTEASKDPPVEEIDLSLYFGEIDGTFVIFDPAKNKTLVHNPERARQRFVPASTFKIPNSLIALDTGVASGPDFALEWNSEIAPRQDWWPESWARNHTLRTALSNSAVWYYQELARRIGPARMQTWVDRFDYGNRNISGGIDDFWLDGSLTISPLEQVGFLRRFHEGRLGVSERATEAVKELLVLEKTAGYRLSGKTGWGLLGERSGTGIGWFVGYLERDDAVYYFATNMDIRKNEDAAARIPITKAILRHFELISD